jgi:2'-5' RNA ligase
VGNGEVLGLVFDLPEAEWMAEVRRMRFAYDSARALFPIEITVAGSSGLGWLSPGQSPEAITAHVRTVAQNVLPFICTFSHVEVFPQSRVYYLALANEEPFHSFQRTLAASPLHFEATEFSYKPHCTIAALSEMAPPAAHVELTAFPIPASGATISSLSLYAVSASTNGCRHVSCIPLGA